MSKPNLSIATAFIIQWNCILISASGAEVPSYPIQPVPMKKITLSDDNFWAPRLETNRKVTVWHNFDQCGQTGRLRNFARAAGELDGTYEGLRFNDSDVYKVLEGTAYILATQPDPKLEAKVNDLIATMTKAQGEDGYLYTVMTVPHPPEKPVKGVGKERWLHERESHETYCMGHLQEAAVAHYEATGDKTLLNVAIKTANLMLEVFGPGKLEFPSGHQQVELGLTELYRVTGNKAYRDLAQFFLEQRGRTSDDRSHTWGEYFQDHVPVCEQCEAVGHSVRAAYQYMAMADIAVYAPASQYQEILHTLWDNVAAKKLYLTGGIGGGSGEGFSAEYELPNLRAYNETCSSIANILWQQRMFQLEGHGKYIDVLERCLFNSFLSGIGMEGDRFFYPNKLTSIQGHQRSPWFNCACCPPNVLRFIPQVPTLTYATRENKLYVNLYGSSTAEVTLKRQTVSLKQTSRYPWNGRVTLKVSPTEAATFAVALRIPGWLETPFPSDLYRYESELKPKVRLSVNGKPVDVKVLDGYTTLRRQWHPGDRIELDIPMPLRRVRAHAKVKSCRDRVAIMRGPLVYCAEGVDNQDKVHSVVIPKDASFSAVDRPELLGGISVLKGQVQTVIGGQEKGFTTEDHTLTLIPYYAWAHRGLSPMRVWHATQPSMAWPQQTQSLAAQSKVRSSEQNRWTRISALNDQILPIESGDREVPRFAWKQVVKQPVGAGELEGNLQQAEVQGGDYWVQYDFPQATEISSSSVYWTVDPKARFRLPQSYRILVRQDQQWKPVTQDLTPEADRFNTVRFSPVITDAVRLEASFAPRSTGGLMEWSIQ